MAQIRLRRPRAGDPWRDFDRLRREMDSLFGRFAGPSSLATAWRGVYPAVNLYDAGDAWVLTAELAGVTPEDIDVSLEGSTATLSGQRRIEVPEGESVSLHRRERQAGSFRRAFELPGAIDVDKVEAVHRNGVLMLRLPKAPESKPRQISIQAG